MSTTSKTIWAIVVVLLIAGAIWFGYSYTAGGSDDTAVRTTVTNFGAAQQKVSLLAPDASAEIASAYSAYVAPNLLSVWQADPSKAPGRQTSSPWPDHIEIGSVEKSSSDAYTVTGSVVLKTSSDPVGGNAGTIPVSLTLQKINGVWLITEYTQSAGVGINGVGVTNPGTGTTATNTPPTGVSTYTHQSPDFSMMYGSQFEVAHGAPTGQSSGYWSELATQAQTGVTYATFTLPKSVQPNTNFSEARLTIGRSANASAVAGCLTASTGNPATSAKTTINGVPFTIITTSDAGAGNLYSTASYRTVKDGACYAIEYTIHTTNIANYPAGTVTAYDESKVKKMLTDVVGSFAFGPTSAHVQ